MQTMIGINQRVALEHGLSLQDAAIFGYFAALRPASIDDFRYHDHRVWFPVTAEQVAEALPLVKYAPKTVRDSIRTLVDVGLLDKRRIDKTVVYAVADAGRAW